MAEATTTIDSPQELRRIDRMNFADKLITVLIETGFERYIDAAARRFWNAGLDLIPKEDPEVRALGYRLALDALVATPVTCSGLAKALRDALIAADPGLAEKEHTPPA